MFKNINLILLIVLLTICANFEFYLAQEIAPDSSMQSLAFKHSLIKPQLAKEVTNVDPLRQQLNYGILAGGGAVVLAAGFQVHQVQKVWWGDSDAKFHVVNDWNYARWVDKAGHFYGTNVLAHAFSGWLEAANMQAEQSAIWSASLALAFQLYVEIYDGFGPDWGFSPGDVAANITGAGFYVAQYYYPFMKNFHPRFSYYPSEDQRKGLREGHNFIDDYHGQIYWMGFRMKNLLPKSWAEYWPRMLMLSAGVGAKQLDGKGGGINEYYIALDVDWEQIPLYGKFWQFIKNSLNYFHLPAPGIKFSKEGVYFVIAY